MTNKKTTKRALIASVISLLLCFTMLLGTTYAWFTDSVTSAENIITAGNLDVTLEFADAKADPEATETEWTDASNTPIFTYENWEPGYVEAHHIKITNAGTLDLKYVIHIEIEDGGRIDDVQKVIDIYYVDPAVKVESRADLSEEMKLGTLEYVLSNPDMNGKLLAGESDTITLALKMQESAGNDYRDMQIGPFTIKLLATQLASEDDSFDNKYDADAMYPADAWDGKADTSWYNDTDTNFIIGTAEQLAGLAELVDDGETFEGKTVRLDNNIDLEAYNEEGELISFNPVGSYAFDKAFKGTFNGQGHIIYNMYENGWALGSGLWDGDDCGLGLFGLIEDATVQNLKIDGADLPSEANLIGSVAGAAYGECLFENITVTNTSMGNHSYYSGGVVGWASGNHKYINCDLDESNVIASQWGDFNNANGGIIGGAGKSGTYYFEDCDVACVLDAFNDVTSAYEWYAYRNCGMLIGNTGRTEVIDGTTYAAADNVTTVNCTVTYGDWANYHYCQFNAMGYPWVRVEEGYSTHAYGNARYDYATDANGNEVKDENHVHNDGEGHNLLLVFDQLFGGSQGGVYGTASHDGVTVIYNNK